MFFFLLFLFPFAFRLLLFMVQYSNGPLNESPNRFLFSMNVINFYDLNREQYRKIFLYTYKHSLWMNFNDLAAGLEFGFFLLFIQHEPHKMRPNYDHYLNTRTITSKTHSSCVNHRVRKKNKTHALLALIKFRCTLYPSGFCVHGWIKVKIVLWSFHSWNEAKKNNNMNRRRENVLNSLFIIILLSAQWIPVYESYSFICQPEHRRYYI